MTDPIITPPPVYVPGLPPKKHTGLKVTVGIIAGLITLGVLTHKDDAPAAQAATVQATPTPTPRVTPHAFGGTKVVPHKKKAVDPDIAYWDGIAQVAWDQQDAATQRAVCVYFRSDSGAALDGIEDGYGGGSASDHAAMRAAASRMLNREC